MLCEVDTSKGNAREVCVLPKYLVGQGDTLGSGDTWLEFQL